MMNKNKRQTCSLPDLIASISVMAVYSVSRSGSKLGIKGASGDISYSKRKLFGCKYGCLAMSVLCQVTMSIRSGKRSRLVMCNRLVIVREIIHE